MKETIRPALVSLAVFTVLCGFVYPLVMDGIAAVVFPHQATGSLIRDRDGHVVGSELIGQPFDNPAYFWSRLTAEANYDASNSTGTNLGPSGFVNDRGQLGPNQTLARSAKDRIDALRAADPTNTQPVPVDLVTSSASGLDPHISPAAAYYQVGRVARLRGQPADAVRKLVDDHLEGRTLGILGEPRVNVLLLNRALDDRFGPSKPNG
ncbi:MAG: potassium-transporting ATPase subunit KdpC [Deltaproteobacteria bacterium]|nr:MAG: potassium-transporting ATPase subunit KdpC [Deltaproteobacteria bacterium]TMQ09749.1 MAG: potassium-transporting ATPase subunit KdpC [Deltaproteobacteria bacterium]